MNKTAAIIVFGALAALGIVGTILLLHFRPDATATLTTYTFTILALVSTFAGNLYVNNKTTEKVEAVRAQTNGTLSKKDEKIDEQAAEIARLNRMLQPDTLDDPKARHAVEE